MDHTPANLAVNARGQTAPEDDDETLRCHRCQYDLRGLPAGRCPECGGAFEPSDLRVADIPWLHRRTLGNWNAYWQTVGRVILHPRRLGSLAWRDVEIDPGESARFRRITVCLTLISWLIAFWAAAAAESLGSFFDADWVALALVTAPGQLLFLILATRCVASLCGRDRIVGRSSRVTALQDFTCAALGLTPLIVAGIVCVAALDRTLGFSRRGDAGSIVLIAGVWCVMGTWWSTTILFHGRALRLTRGVQARQALLLPIAWTVLAAGAMLVSGILFVVVGVATGRF